MTRSLLAAALAALSFAAAPARAQTPPLRYDLQNLNFDLWCQETMHYPAERCDKRDPKDNAEFQRYRAVIEKYELQRLKTQRSDQERSQSILHADTLDQRPGSAHAEPGQTGTLPDPH